MKKALKLFFAFFLFLIIGTILGTLFYSLYIGTLTHVVGTNTNFFTRGNIISAFFLTVEVLAVIMGFMLISYRLRHQGGVLQLIAFIITQVVCWGILLPSSFYLENYFTNKYEAEIRAEDESHQLTKGFFRFSGKTVYYFMDDLQPYYAPKDNGTTTVRISTRENGRVSIMQVKNPEILDITKNADPYNDILVKKSFELQSPSGLGFILGIIEMAKNNFFAGWTFWLGFMSLGFALACVYGLSNISNWRLISFSVCFISTVALLYWNYGYYTPFLEDFRTTKIANLNIGSLGNYVGNQFLIITNLFFGILMIIIGIITHFVKKHHR